MPGPTPTGAAGSWFHGTRQPPTEKQKKHSTDTPVHISVVLDRSGSMASIATDIVGGFNEFLADQRNGPGTARVTLVQFDSHDPFEVLIDATDLADVADLDHSTYQPRGLTPLYDAVGRMVGRIDAGITKRSADGLAEEDQVVVIVTDGLENASQQHTRQTVFELIEDRRRSGWVFVFVGANQDVYATGRAMAVSPHNRARWESTPEGSRKMWRHLSHSAGAHRSKPRPQRRTDADAFYQEDPDVE